MHPASGTRGTVHGAQAKISRAIHVFTLTGQTREAAVSAEQVGRKCIATDCILYWPCVLKLKEALDNVEIVCLFYPDRPHLPPQESKVRIVERKERGDREGKYGGRVGDRREHEKVYHTMAFCRLPCL